MHGCESVYIILEQIFCTRNDGALCVISTHLYLCHVIRLVILYIRSLRIGTGENGRAGGREKKAKRRMERGNEREREGSLDTRKSKKRERKNRPGTTRALRRLFLSAWGGGRDTIKSILPIGLSIP